MSFKSTGKPGDLPSIGVPGAISVVITFEPESPVDVSNFFVRGCNEICKYLCDFYCILKYAPTQREVINIIYKHKIKSI